MALTGIQAVGVELKALEKSLKSPFSNVGVILDEVSLENCEFAVCLDVIHAGFLR